MNLDRIVQVLKKVNALVENMDDQGQTSAIERDLLLRYLRDLYEHVSDQDAGAPSKIAAKPEAISHNNVPAEPLAEVRSEPKADPIQHKEPARASQGQQVKDPVFSKEEQTTYYDAESSELPAEAEIPETSAEAEVEDASPKYYPPADVSSVNTEAPSVKRQDQTDIAVSTRRDDARFAAVFSERNATDLADKFKLQPITSIESAMGINQRLQTINELFEGDHNAFVDTLKELNSVSDFSQAKRLLITGAADKFNWDEDDKLKLAGDFVELVRRKYV